LRSMEHVKQRERRVPGPRVDRAYPRPPGGWLGSAEILLVWVLVLINFPAA
jgi:hypothetical protein